MLYCGMLYSFVRKSYFRNVPQKMFSQPLLTCYTNLPTYCWQWKNRVTANKLDLKKKCLTPLEFYSRVCYIFYAIFLMLNFVYGLRKNILYILLYMYSVMVAIFFMNEHVCILFYVATISTCKLYVAPTITASTT